MIKLSDYLDYLNQEIIQARKKADENAVLVAKQYAQHPYLKFFKVPRYSIPVIKMDIPIKVADIDADSKFNFKIDPKLFMVEVNEKIALVNKEKNLNISPVTEAQTRNDDFKNLFKTLENRDQRYIKNLSTVIKKIDLAPQIRSLNLGIFRPQAGEDENNELARILSETIASKYTLVASRLNNLYIDPDTTKAEDKDKMFINLHVEMEEEGLRIVKFTNKEGQEIEEITFE